MFTTIRFGASCVRVPLSDTEKVSALAQRAKELSGSLGISFPEFSLCAADGALLPLEAKVCEVLKSGEEVFVKPNLRCGAPLTMRQQLAAAFHMAVRHGWDQVIYNHFTGRVPGKEAFFVHRFGWLFSEVTASSLLEVDLETGELLDSVAEGDMPYNRTSYVIHSCIYRSRPEVQCVMHVHVPCVVAVASAREGLVIGLSQESSLVGPVAYHDYEGLSVHTGEQERIVRDLGKSNVLFLRNHGVVVCGTSVAHAMSLLYHVWRACLVQVNTHPENRIVPDESLAESARQEHDAFTQSGNYVLEFEAQLRQLMREDKDMICLK